LKWLEKFRQALSILIFILLFSTLQNECKEEIMADTDYFMPFRENVIGVDYEIPTPFGRKKLVYADWTASGRLYRSIETLISDQFGPLVGNTHSESSITGTTMTQAYHQAQHIIKNHVNASDKDVLIHAGFGMTAAVNKFQRILGLKIPEQLAGFTQLPTSLRPVVFITHMEHHSNHTSWLETIADVVVLEPHQDGLVDLNVLEEQLSKYRNRQLKIGAFTACSNVTGISTPIHDMARLLHDYDGYCFVDFAASAPYIDINMHPKDHNAKLDAIFFSPHKFLGGPGSSGVLIFDSQLYKNRVPDHPGGGTVDWTNPWGQHKFIANIEAREDGGTPGFLQSIRAALAIRLKEKMDPKKMLERERKLVLRVLKRLSSMKKCHVLAQNVYERLGIISFYVEDIHYNLIVKLLNDRFGIQVRGGCSCAGTYGHYLLHVDPTRSRRITEKINHGDLSEKPGWVRLSLHPIMTDQQVDFILDAIEQTVLMAHQWQKDYCYSAQTNEFKHCQGDPGIDLEQWFTI
jgi:selenocysteine lyase/cysteine desulfurase